MAAREIMDTIGVGQKYCNEIIGKAQTIGNNLGLPEPALANTLEGLEEDIEEETGVTVRMPLDVKGADILLVTPSADFFAEPHVDGLIGYAKVFHQAGLSWTSPVTRARPPISACSSAPMKTCRCWRYVFGKPRSSSGSSASSSVSAGTPGESPIIFSTRSQGHSIFSIAITRCPSISAKLPTIYCSAMHLKMDPSANDDMVLTFHDSCNIARGSRMGDFEGGQFVIPREVIKASCNHFVDMPAIPSKRPLSAVAVAAAC